MGALITVLFILIFVVVPIAAICMQTIPTRLEGVTFRDTAPDYAWKLVAQYAHGTFDQRWGYPTGYFHINSKTTKPPSRLVMREAQPSGAITDGCTAMIGAFGLEGFDAGCGPGLLIFCAVAVIGSPFFAVSFLDRFFRFMLRSRVDVQFTRSGQDTIASFAFYGPSGYSMRQRYAKAFAKPELPTALYPAQAAAPAGSLTGAAPERHVA